MKRGFSKALVGMIVVLLCCALYGVWLEPRWMETTRYSFRVSDLDRSVKIVHITDLHLTKVGALETSVLDAVRGERPDIIVVTGDTVDKRDSLESGMLFLSQLTAALGVYAVSGNWEHWSLSDNQQRSLASLGNVTFLNNASVQVLKGLWLVGQDDLVSGRSDEQKAFASVPEGANCIGFFHAPEAFSHASRKCVLNLAGHTHGGQVRLPFIGALWLPPGSGHFVSGWYADGPNKLYVSRGLGTSILPVRFLARPELTIMNLEAQ